MRATTRGRYWGLAATWWVVASFAPPPAPRPGVTAAVRESWGRRSIGCGAVPNNTPRERLEALVRETGPVEDDLGLLPVNEAAWTYLPGIREVVRVHAPALTYLFCDVVLPSASRSYAQLLEGETETAVVVEVLDAVRTKTELFALVHCTHRVKLGPLQGGLARRAEAAPIFDAEELAAASGDPARAAALNAAWAAIDDPVDDFKPTWLRDGGTTRSLDRIAAASTDDSNLAAGSVAENDDEAAALEARLWTEIDTLVALVRKSRTSGRFDLPPVVAALRRARSSTAYPAYRRRFRLSFAVASLLDLDRAADRQAWLQCTSTADRLHLAIDRLVLDRKNLAAFLALDAVRKGRGES